MFQPTKSEHERVTYLFDLGCYNLAAEIMIEAYLCYKADIGQVNA